MSMAGKCAKRRRCDEHSAGKEVLVVGGQGSGRKRGRPSSDICQVHPHPTRSGGILAIVGAERYEIVGGHARMLLKNSPWGIPEPQVAVIPDGCTITAAGLIARIGCINQAYFVIGLMIGEGALESKHFGPLLQAIGRLNLPVEEPWLEQKE